MLPSPCLCLLVLALLPQEDRTAGYGFGFGSGPRFGRRGQAEAPRPRRLQGRILDAAGEPVPGLSIRIPDAEEDPGCQPATGRSNADGSFAVAGTWRSRATFLVWDEAPEAPFPPFRGYWSARSDGATLEIRLPGHRRALEVLVGEPDGREARRPFLLLDPGRLPLDASTVPFPTADTGARGIARGLPPGSWRLLVALQGSVWWDAGAIRIPEDLGTRRLAAPAVRPRIFLLRDGEGEVAAADRLRVARDGFWQEVAARGALLPDGLAEVQLADPLRAPCEVRLGSSTRVLLPARPAGVLRVELPFELQERLKESDRWRLSLRVLDGAGRRITRYRPVGLQRAAEGWRLEQLPPGAVQVFLLDRRAREAWHGKATVRAGEVVPLRWEEEEPRPVAELLPPGLAGTPPVEELRPWLVLPWPEPGTSGRRLQGALLEDGDLAFRLRISSHARLLDAAAARRLHPEAVAGLLLESGEWGTVAVRPSTEEDLLAASRARAAALAGPGWQEADAVLVPARGRPTAVVRGWRPGDPGPEALVLHLFRRGGLAWELLAAAPVDEARLPLWPEALFRAFGELPGTPQRPAGDGRGRGMDIPEYREQIEWK